MYVFFVRDKTGRLIYMSKERYCHILKHPEMQNKMEEIKETLQNPLKITSYAFDGQIKYYHKHCKLKKSKARYLRVIVKYLNGAGFIVTSYLVDRIK